MRDLFKIHEQVFEVTKNWAFICNEEIEDVYMSVSSLSGYIRLKEDIYYLKDLIKLSEMLKEIDVETTTIENGDEGTEVWFLFHLYE